MKAKAALSDGKGSFFFDDVEIGEPQAGEVLIEMKASGVCHTDWDTLNRTDHIILGHEGAGVVADVGEGVARVSPQDRVVLNWAIPCGSCFQCRRGAENICEDRTRVPADRFRYKGSPIITSFGLGTMASYAVVPEAAVVRLDEGADIPFSSACILGCGIMTGVGSVLNAARVEEGSAVVVLGSGGVGLSVIQGSIIAGAAVIVAVDVKPQRLELARQFGATDTIKSEPYDAALSAVVEQVLALTQGRGADYAFECVAVPELGPAPLAMIRNGGTAVGVSGIERSVSFDMELFEWDKTYINPLYGQCRPAIDFPRLVEYYREGRLKLDEMVTRTYALDELGVAFEDMHAGRNAKGVLLIS